MNLNQTRKTIKRDESRTLDADSTIFSSPKPRRQISRQSIALTSDPYSDENLELELEYNEYLLSFGNLILEKKKLKDVESSAIVLIKTLKEETKTLQETYRKLHTRIEDIKTLTAIHHFSDDILDTVQDFNSKVKQYEIKEILSKQEALLNRFNVLRCENIIIPKSEQEIKQFEETLEDCLTILKKVSDPIESEILEECATEHEELVKTVREISKIKKILEEAIQIFQMQVLKSSSELLRND